MRITKTKIVYTIGAMIVLTTIFPASASNVREYVGSYEAFIDSAENCIKRENFAEAAQFYRKALKKNPASPLNSKVFANLGMCLTETGEFDEAIQAYDVALVREPESIAILTSRAKTLLRQGNDKEALADLNKALSIDSIAQTPLRLRGRLLMATGNTNRALKDFSVLRRNFKDDDIGTSGMAQCYAIMGMPSQAATLYQEAVSQAPTEENYEGLVSALLNCERYDDAKDVLHEAINKFPRNGEMYLLRGVLHYFMHRNEEALVDKKTAIVLGVDVSKADIAIPLKNMK